MEASRISPEIREESLLGIKESFKILEEIDPRMTCSEETQSRSFATIADGRDEKAFFEPAQILQLRDYGIKVGRKPVFAKGS